MAKYSNMNKLALKGKSQTDKLTNTADRGNHITSLKEGIMQYRSAVGTSQT